MAILAAARLPRRGRKTAFLTEGAPSTPAPPVAHEGCPPPAHRYSLVCRDDRGVQPRQTATRRRRRKWGRRSRLSSVHYCMHPTSMCSVRVCARAPPRVSSRVGGCFLPRRASPRVAERRIVVRCAFLRMVVLQRCTVTKRARTLGRHPACQASHARAFRESLAPCMHKLLCLHLYTTLITFVLQRIQRATPLSMACTWPPLGGMSLAGVDQGR